MKHIELIEKEIRDIATIHVARTWERQRVLQPFEEMPFDNISSTDAILDIVDDVMSNSHIQKFIYLKAVGHIDHEDYFVKNTGTLSDTFIEERAEDYIKEYIL